MGALRGKVVLLTGSTAGIGAVAAASFAEQGATLVLAARNQAKAEALATRLKEETGNTDLHILLADMSVQAEVVALAETFRSRFERLDVLVNNAGAMFERRDVSADGWERTFALNHMAYFRLTLELRDLLRASAPARVVSVASRAHENGKMHWDDLQLERGYSGRGWAAYSQSKLCNILFTRELARRLDGTGISATCLHPGFVATSFGHNNGGLFRSLLRFSQLFGRSPEAGADTLIWAASAPEAEGLTGVYLADREVRSGSAASQDMEAAARLWSLSEELAEVQWSDGAAAP